MRGTRPALSGPFHTLSHVLLVLLGWFIFGWFWWKVLFKQSPHPADITLLVLASLVIVPLITLYWVLHNRGIYSRKGPRQEVRSIVEIYDQDWAGRPVKARFEELRQSRLVIINSSSGEKHFFAPSDMLNTNNLRP